MNLGSWCTIGWLYRWFVDNGDMNGTLSLFIAARGHFKWVQMDSFGMVICFHAGRSPSPSNRLVQLMMRKEMTSRWVTGFVIANNHTRWFPDSLGERIQGPLVCSSPHGVHVELTPFLKIAADAGKFHFPTSPVFLSLCSFYTPFRSLIGSNSQW